MNRHLQEGSFTVEMTLVMLIVLGVIFSVIYAGFYMHDRCVLAGGTYEAAVWGAHQARLQNKEAQAASAVQEFLEGKLLLCTVQSVGGSSSGTEAKATSVGTVPIPGIAVLRRILTIGDPVMRCEQSCPCPDRENIIRLTREVLSGKE